LALARFVGIDVDARLAAFVGESTASPKRKVSAHDLLNALRGGRRVSELARAVGTDRTTLARWLAGKTAPPFSALLAFIETTTHRLLDFVSVFADPLRLESTRKATEALRAQRALAYDDPWSHAVLRALELSPHGGRSQVEWIAARTGRSLDEVATALKRLVRAGQVRGRSGSFSLATALPVDTRNDPEANVLLKRHWLDVARQRLDKTRAQGEGLYSFNLFAVSGTGFAQIRKLHIEYFERLRSIVSEERGGDRVVLVNMQLVPLDE
jgi:transcriptional regulator with XRE-family HTH domain